MFEKEPHLQRVWNTIRILPTALCLWVIGGLTACYGWDRYKIEDGERDFPMISHMGAYPPQSCFFTLILCLAAFFLFVIVLIQHRLVLLNLLNKDQSEQESCLGRIQSKFNILNDVSFVAGVLCAFFLSVVGSFQTQNLSDWHRAGFIGFIGLGFVYLVLLCVLTFSSAQYSVLKWGRVALTFSLALTLLAFVIFKNAAYSQWDPSDEDQRHSSWTDDDGGYKQYFTAAIIEFVAMVLFLSLIVTLQFDFWKTFDDICDTKRHQENGQQGQGNDVNGAEADQRRLLEADQGVPLQDLAEPEGG